MPDVKIDALPPKTVASTDIVPVVDAAGTATSRVTAGAIAGLAPVVSVAGRTGAVTLTSSDISGLSSGVKLGTVLAHL